MSDQELEQPETQADDEQDLPEPPAAPAEDEPDADDVDTDDDEQPDGDDEPEPQAQALSQKEIEKRLNALQRESERHAKRVAEIMGDDRGMLLDCPLCDSIIPGYVMPTPQTPARFPAVREFMGDTPKRELREDPDATRCEVCDGWGVLDTASRVQGQVELVCKTCNGRGWVGPRAQAQPVHGFASTTEATPANGEAPPLQVADSPEVAALKAQGYIIIDPPPRPVVPA